MNWTRLDNIEPYKIGNRLDYIREEAECRGFEFQEDAHEYVCGMIETELPTMYSKLSFDDILTEYDTHELYDDEAQATYAIYIHLSDLAVKLLIEEFPEDLI